MNSPQYFGTDGIRGTAGLFPMTWDFVYQLGRAAAQVLRDQHGQPPRLVVARDTRESGFWLSQALLAGLRAEGAYVRDLGVLPTPAVAFLTQSQAAHSGAVISASHNPAAENGIKFFNDRGMKLSEAQELAIEARLADLLQEVTPEIPDEPEHIAAELAEEYIRDLLNEQPGLDLSGLRILLDCANGAQYAVAPIVLRELGADLVVLNAEPDGQNINDHAGSEAMRSDPADFAARLREHQADLGIAFDGDADRVILMDEKGNLVDGDHMLAMLAAWLHKQSRLLGDALVTTTMANGGLKVYAEQQGYTLMLTPVGDKYVTDELLKLAQADGSEGKMGVGGEQSGHIILLDGRHHTGDGLRTALAILAILREQPGQTLSQLTGQIAKFPQLIASCKVAQKIPLDQLPDVQAFAQQIRDQLPGLQTLNMRYSGTESKFRLMLEADTRHSPAELAALAWQMVDQIQASTGTPPGAKAEVMNVAEGGLIPRPSAA